MSIKTIGELYRVDGELLYRQYKQYISGFEDWELRDKAEEYVLFPNNIGSHLSIDETCLSHNELYTIVTNKAFKGKKGSLVAMIKGTKADVVVDVLKKISIGKRSLVKEVALDLSPLMQLIVKRSFPCPPCPLCYTGQRPLSCAETARRGDGRYTNKTSLGIY